MLVFLLHPAAHHQREEWLSIGKENKTASLIFINIPGITIIKILLQLPTKCLYQLENFFLCKLPLNFYKMLNSSLSTPMLTARLHFGIFLEGRYGHMTKSWTMKCVQMWWKLSVAHKLWKNFPFPSSTYWLNVERNSRVSWKQITTTRWVYFPWRLYQIHFLSHCSGSFTCQLGLGADKIISHLKNILHLSDKFMFLSLSFIVRKFRV